MNQDVSGSSMGNCVINKRTKCPVGCRQPDEKWWYLEMNLKVAIRPNLAQFLSTKQPQSNLQGPNCNIRQQYYVSSF